MAQQRAGDIGQMECSKSNYMYHRYEHGKFMLLPDDFCLLSNLLCRALAGSF